MKLIFLKVFPIIIFFIFMFLISPSEAEAAILLGRVYIKDPEAYPSCPNSMYYLGDNCGNSACYGNPNYTVTWTQGTPPNTFSNSVNNNSCYLGNSRYTFEGTSSPNGDAGGKPVTVDVTISNPDYVITKWDRNTTFSDGSNCGKPYESGSFATAGSNQTITLTVYEDGDCKWNHLWFWAEPVTLSGKATNSSGSPLTGVTINQNDATSCAIGTTVTDGSGNYSFSNIPVGKFFCLRPPAVTGYTSPSNPPSYECQTAGKSMGTVTCGTSTALDQAIDNQYNFVYTPTSCVITASPNPCTIPSGSTTCTSTVTWTTNTNVDIKLQETGQLFAQSGPPGGGSANNAPWILESGITFNCLDRSTQAVLDSRRVTGTSGPGLGTLRIRENAADGAVGITDGASYGISGLRSDDPNLAYGTSGSNYYNSLIITQETGSNANSSNTKLIGVAFTGKGADAPVGSDLQALKTSVDRSGVNGFIMVYAFCANQPTCLAAGRTFTRGSFSVYYQGIWVEHALNDPVQLTGIKINMLSIPTLPTGPTFYTTFYSQLGNRTWGTYGYIMDTDNTEKSAALSPTP